MLSFKLLIILSLFCGFIMAVPQFWKLNTLSERDMFILDVRSTMSAGICYKQVEAKANDPELRIRTISFCCPGYKRNHLSPHSVKCDPICEEEECNNGICAGPNECECFPGYARQGGHCESLY